MWQIIREKRVWNYYSCLSWLCTVCWSLCLFVFAEEKWRGRRFSARVVGRCHCLPSQFWHLRFCTCRQCWLGPPAAHFFHLQRDFTSLPFFLVHSMAECFTHTWHLELDLCTVQRITFLGLAVRLLVLRIWRAAFPRYPSRIGRQGQGNYYHPHPTLLCHHGHDVHFGSFDRLGPRLLR